LIQQQQRQVADYQRRLDDQQRRLASQTGQLEQQRRMSQYRFQQAYFERLREQDARLRERRFDYYNDPYFYTAPVYRYYRGGSYYEINQYGADALRRAINVGYEEGFRAGEADRMDGWRADYDDNYAFQDATYGYDGYYTGIDDYQYYFRQGFQRGYEDGYYSRFQYGYYADGSYGVLGNILSAILNFQALR